MNIYQNWSRIIETGAPLGGATITVFRTGTAIKALLYEDAAGVTPLANPFTSDADTGIFAFYVTDGAYDILVEKAGATSYTIADMSIRTGMAYGQLYVLAAAAALVTIPDTINYVEASAPVWTLLPTPRDFNESDGNGRLTYIGVEDIIAHIACSISFTCVGNNKLIHWRLGKNGTTDPGSEVQRFVAAGADVGSTALHLITPMSTGDHLSLWVRNATSADDVTVEVANLQAVGTPA